MQPRKQVFALAVALARFGFAAAYDGVSMECVTSFNWNTGNTDIYGSATNGDADCSGGWSTDGTKLTLSGATQPRMFFKKSDGSVLTFDMKSDRISWWMDLSQLGASFNGALYSSWTNATENAPDAAKWYCDANDGAGNGLWCPEFDMLESNLCGLRSTSHGCVTNASGINKPTSSEWPIYCDLVEYSNSTDCNQFCYREGDGLWFTSIKALGTRCGDSQSCNYGDGEGYAIDTTQPIHGESTFTYVGNNLVKFTTSLSQEQGGTQVLSQTNSYQAYPEGFPENGRMGLLAQLWNYTETSGMAWLSGDNCPYNQGEGGLPSVEDVTFSLWDIEINGDTIHFA